MGMKKESMMNGCSRVILILLLAVLTSSFVFGLAALNAISPSASQNVSGIVVLNASIDNGDGVVTNITFEFKDSDGNGVLNQTVYNVTARIFTNSTFDTAVLSDGTYNITIHATNGTANITNSSIILLTIDNTGPNVSAINSPASGADFTSGSITLNATVNDATLAVSSVLFNVSNSSGQQVLLAAGSGGATYNATLNLTALAEGNYNITVVANDTLNNVNKTQYVGISVDRTGPSISIDEDSSTTTTITVDFSCSDGISGISSCELISEEGDVDEEDGIVSDLECGTTYTIEVEATDNAGNSHNESDEMTTDDCDDDNSGGGGGNPTTTTKKVTTVKKSESWQEVTAGSSETMDGFSDEIAIEEILISVDEDAEDVKITVTKYDDTPSGVDEKSGEVYQYVEIDADNLEDKLSEAVVLFRVEREWASDNNLANDSIRVYKFNEENDEWNELTTMLTESDTVNYYYEVILEDFSYFAISAKSVTEDSAEAATTSLMGNEETSEASANSADGWSGKYWLIGIVVLAILCGAGYYYFIERKKQR